jgi:putative ABC transport system permease protein
MIQDLNYALRSLFRQPSFAVTAILILSVGIGSMTAIFSVVNAVVFRPLPFERPDRIVTVMNLWTKSGAIGSTVSAPDFYDWKTQSRSFRAFAYYLGGETSVTSRERADYASVYRVSPEFFDALGVRTTVGRLLSAEEQRPGGPLAVVITDAFWKQQFNGDVSALGSTIKFADRLFTIVGVLAPGLRFPARADIYCPSWIVPETTSRSAHNYRVVARLQDGVTVEQANAEMDPISRQLEQAYPSSNAAKHAIVRQLKDVLVSGTKPTFDMLMATAAVVLLIACANVANLLLARSSVRSREMVVRAAVGASRWRLIRQLLTESVVLGTVAGLAGVWFARLGVLALVALAPPDLPRTEEVAVDGTALYFALLVALAASLVFGLAPALQVSRVHLVDALREGGKGSAQGSRGGWARSTFVVVEVALAMVLVAGAGLLARSLAALASVDMGFNTERVLVLRTAFPIRSFQEAPRATAFYRDLIADVRAVPGVSAAAGVRSVPTVPLSNGGYSIEGAPTLAELGVRSPQALFNVVTPDYFRTLRVAVTRGRDFSPADTRDAPFVAIVNESLVRASFPSEDPIGRRIQCGLDSQEYMTIVGVVADFRARGPARPVEPEIFMPYEQHPGPASSLNLAVRTEVEDPLTVVETIRRKITERNSDVPMKASTLDGVLETASATSRFRTFLVCTFATVALFLAFAGVYGVMAYTVSQRIPELGVRIALGATPENIMRLIVLHGAKLAGMGMVLGFGLSLWASRLLQGLLFGVTARDPWTLALVAVAVAVATLAATYIPGRRAVRVDPMIALRAQ